MRNLSVGMVSGTEQPKSMSPNEQPSSVEGQVLREHTKQESLMITRFVLKVQLGIFRLDFDYWGELWGFLASVLLLAIVLMWLLPWLHPPK